MLVQQTLGNDRIDIMKTKKDLGWKPLYGLGKDLWKGEDAQEYVDRLREDRKPASTKVRSFNLGVKGL